MSGIICDRRVSRTHLTIHQRGKREYWGKYLPKDIKALLDYIKQNGVEMPIRQIVNDYNDKLLNSQSYKSYKEYV